MPISCVVISGFLGSGKTTLIRRLLQQAGAQRLRPLLVINEAGTVDVDGPLLAQYGAEQVTLLGGCICCAKHEELGAVVDGLLSRASGDLLLIECSGMASPREVVEVVAPFAQRQRVAPPLVVTVLDAARIQRQRLVVDLVKEQVATADLVLLNKQDRVLPEHRKALDILVAAFASPHALRYWTTHSQLSDAQFDSLLRTSGRSALRASGHTGHGHQLYHVWESTTVHFPIPVSLACLHDLLCGVPGGLDRMKGFINTSDAGWQLVQHVAGETEVTSWVGSPPVDISTLVALGMPADLARLHELVVRLKMTTQP